MLFRGWLTIIVSCFCIGSISLSCQVCMLPLHLILIFSKIKTDNSTEKPKPANALGELLGVTLLSLMPHDTGSVLIANSYAPANPLRMQESQGRQSSNTRTAALFLRTTYSATVSESLIRVLIMRRAMAFCVRFIRCSAVGVHDEVDTLFSADFFDDATHFASSLKLGSWQDADAWAQVLWPHLCVAGDVVHLPTYTTTCRHWD